MRFSVSAAWVEVGALLPPEQVIQVIEQSVIPSLEMLAQWEKEGRIQGGVFAAEREGVFLLEAASAEEVGALLTQLPFWGMVKWHVRPLQSTASVVERERALIARARGTAGG